MVLECTVCITSVPLFYLPCELLNKFSCFFPVGFIKDKVGQCEDFHSLIGNCLCLASYRAAPLTSTDKHLLTTVKISFNPSDEEGMTCSMLQMQHNLKNKPRCGWSCVKSVSVGACRRRWKTGTTCIKKSPRDVSEEMWRHAARF